MTRIKHLYGAPEGAPLQNTLKLAFFSSLFSRAVSGMKVGVPRKAFFDDLQPDVTSCADAALAVIKKQVAEVRDMPLDVAGHRTIFNAEIYEYHEEMVTTHPELYDPRTLPRVLHCAGISATDYIRAWRDLAAERTMALQSFEQVDVVVTPTVPVAAPRISELESLEASELRRFEMKYLLRNTQPFSVLDWPSVSVPCGFTREGLPVGLQISGRLATDAAVLRLANAYEQATEWHNKTVQK
jgi:aspartyl-tRNA(Asn)/glutamyl-tRNA(Gln) amidotransferase subunit A